EDDGKGGSQGIALWREVPQTTPLVSVCWNPRRTQQGRDHQGYSESSQQRQSACADSPCRLQNHPTPRYGSSGERPNRTLGQRNVRCGSLSYAQNGRSASNPRRDLE